MQSSTRCFKNTILFRNIREYHVRSISFLDFVQFRLLDGHIFLVEVFTKLLLLTLVKPFLKFQFAMHHRSFSELTNQQDNPDVRLMFCVRSKTFCKDGFFELQNDLSPKIPLCKKILHQRWCPLQTSFLHLREGTRKVRKFWEAFAFSSFRNLAVGFVEM